MNKKNVDFKAKVEKIEAFKKVHQELSKNIGVLRQLFQVPEGAFIESIFKLQDLALTNLAEIIDIPLDSLEWFIYENDFGKKALECEFSGSKYKIDCILNFIMFEEILKSSK